jgi:exopolysaccharide production protein ExoQ
MSKASTHSLKSGRPKSSVSTFDICAMVPVLACAYSVVIQPLIYFNFPPAPGLQGLLESRTENRIFWPALAAISIVLAVRYRSRVGRLALPPNIIWLLVYAGFAGASVSWAFKPELSLIRFVQEAMVLTAIILPAMLAARTADIMRGVFLCFACAVIVNALLIPGGRETTAMYGSTQVEIGYPGYFSFKGLLGECAAIAFLLSLHEMLYPGGRRALGIIIAVIAIVLLFLSSSKTALGLAILAPFLAGLTLISCRTFRVSPAILLMALVLCYVVGSNLSGFTMERVSYMLTGDASFTGRTTIWYFAESEIARNPFLGWGYQSFWLVGPDAPSIVDAPGWVKMMPNSHSGYYDTMLELGYAGLALLLGFILATLHVIGRVADRNRARGWLLLSVALFIVIYNFLETLWMRAFDMLWVVFVIAAVEAARHWQPALLKGPLLKRPARELRPARPVGHGRLRGALSLRLRPRL